MRFGPIATAVLLVCSTAGATELPALPELPPAGSSLDTLDRNVFRCEKRDSGNECRRAGETRDRVEGEPVVEIVLVYRQGLLVRSVIALDEQRFRALAERLTGSLGPADQGGEDLNAGMGGTFKNHFYLWRQGGRAWLLEQFFERIIRSGLWIMNRDEVDVLMTERERSRVRGVRNL
jgi:hypothetical protein